MIPEHFSFFILLFGSVECIIQPRNETQQRESLRNTTHTENKSMKRNEIVAELTKIADMKSADAKVALADIIARLTTAAPDDAGKLVHYLHVMPAVCEPNVKYPTQMLQCHAAIYAASGEGTTRITRSQAIAACENAGTIVTRQSIERIFAFYQKRMEDECWIKREVVREA